VVVLFYFILFYFLLSGVWTLIHMWSSNAADKRNHSSSEASPGLGTKWRRQGVVLEASIMERVFSLFVHPLSIFGLCSCDGTRGRREGERDYSK